MTVALPDIASSNITVDLCDDQAKEWIKGQVSEEIVREAIIHFKVVAQSLSIKQDRVHKISSGQVKVLALTVRLNHIHL
jgi:predicted small metal-binding protein